MSIDTNVGHSSRFIVRDGAQFYISQAAHTANTSPFAIADPDAVNWAPYDPAAPFDIKFAGTTFGPHAFTDVTAVGYYAQEASGAATALRVNGFDVNADVPEPAALGTLALAGGLAGLRRRRRCR